MKKNYILALFLTLILIIATYFVSDTKYVAMSQVKSSVSSQKFNVNSINQTSDKYDIIGYMPVTKTQELDEKIKQEYDSLISEFKKETESLTLPEDGKKFTFNINFNDYEYDNKYISFVISYSSDFGGAHPDNDIYTINYDKTQKYFIDIEYLIDKNENILNLFSDTSYKTFENKDEFKDDLDTLKNGTLPKKDNFKKFILSQNGIILFFPNYCLASYYLGDFEAIIPYTNINL